MVHADELPDEARRTTLPELDHFRLRPKTADRFEECRRLSDTDDVDLEREQECRQRIFFLRQQIRRDQK
ncbi:MAG TPA: hypothetical protein VER58_03660 [Thermoanaerobaculia bacterium]|nr:hypothetical protein [Thermoanaerobaculia bacterium]